MSFDPGHAKVGLEWIGLALLGKAPSFGKALVVSGPAGTGKSTFIGMVEELFPSDTRTAFPLQAFAKEVNLAAVAGMRLNTCAELPSATLAEVEPIKALITARDDMQARTLYEPPFRFRPIAAHLMSANTLPRVEDPSGAFFDRVLVVRADRRVRGTKGEHRDLVKSITRSELGAIASLALRHGEKALVRGHYYPAPSCARALSLWRRASTSPAPIFDELFARPLVETVETIEAGNTIGAGIAYRAYQEWSKARGLAALHKAAFAEGLAGLGIREVHAVTGKLLCMRWKSPEALAWFNSRRFPTENQHVSAGDSLFFHAEEQKNKDDQHATKGGAVVSTTPNYLVTVHAATAFGRSVRRSARRCSGSSDGVGVP